MLYPTDDWNVTKALVQRAESAGSPAIVLTVDRQGGRNTEDMFARGATDMRECNVLSQARRVHQRGGRKSNFSGIDVSKVTNLYGTGMTWDFIDRLRKIVKGKLVMKGIMTGEDARRRCDTAWTASSSPITAAERKRADRRRSACWPKSSTR